MLNRMNSNIHERIKNVWEINWQICKMKLWIIKGNLKMKL